MIDTRAVLVPALLLLATGCGLLSVPRIAVPGTTIAIPVPAAFKSGFGRTLQDPANPPTYNAVSPKEDPQRGELVFELVDYQGGHVAYLPVRFVTRVGADESAPAVIEGATELQPGQVVAFVDIPADVPATPDPAFPDAILVERWRRTEGNPDVWEVLETKTNQATTDWLGWGTTDPTAGIPIVIQEQPGGAQDPWYADLTGWGEFFGSYGPAAFTQNDLTSAVPLPILRIRVHEADVGLTSPAAWEMELTYPAKRIIVKNVSLRRAGPSAALVAWDPGGTGAPTCSTADQTLRIQMIDPERKAKGVNVAFELANFDQPCGARAVEGDFQIQTFRAYDDGGVEYTASISKDVP